VRKDKAPRNNSETFDVWRQELMSTPKKYQVIAVNQCEFRTGKHVHQKSATEELCCGLGKVVNTPSKTILDTTKYSHPEHNLFNKTGVEK
jgi:hypothetical protein